MNRKKAIREMCTKVFKYKVKIKQKVKKILYTVFSIIEDNDNPLQYATYIKLIQVLTIFLQEDKKRRISVFTMKMH